MNWDHIEANWDQFINIIRQKWEKLTAQQLNAIQGNRNKLADIIKDSYGISKIDADQQVDSWIKLQDEEAYLIERASERNGAPQ
jgi:uncharacterized protein YjbJ (UPF0337 family)